MRNVVRSGIAVVLLLMIGSIGFTQSSDEQLIAQGKELINLLNSGKFAEAVERFDAQMKQALPADRLEQTWKTIVGQAGAFKDVSEGSMMKVQGFDVAVLTCNFEKIALRGTVAFNAEKKIAGFQMGPKPQ